MSAPSLHVVSNPLGSITTRPTSSNSPAVHRDGCTRLRVVFLLVSGVTQDAAPARPRIQSGSD